MFTYLSSFFFSNLEEQFPLSKRDTDMSVIECKRCHGWVPQEKFPFIRRRNKKFQGSCCKECIVHRRKCRLTQSYLGP